MSRTREAPTPTNISTKSDPEILKKGTPASPAIALASRVFPVPGAPASRTPVGMRPPRAVNLPGSFKKSTISSSSSFASSIPATSPNVTLLSLCSVSLALFLPKESAPPFPPPCIWRMKKTQTPMSSSIGNQETKMVINQESLLASLTLISTPAPLRMGINSLSAIGYIV